MQPIDSNHLGNQKIPSHLAIIMDGNGRWAKNRHLPRTAGHHAGVKSVRKVVDYCGKKGVNVLTLFAFSSENWRRPQEEVSVLMELFISTLQKEIQKLCENNISLRFVGDRTAFSDKLQAKIVEGEQATANNSGLKLVIAANYGGRWDICQAVKIISGKVSEGELLPRDLTEVTISNHLSMSDLPEPDLFIRTGGEKRISNFLLWQLAYTELYFTKTLWPDFDDESLDQAIKDFQSRQRRFGYTSEQIISKAVNV